MKQALIVIEELKRLYAACIKSESKYLKTDYGKQIKKLKKDLKEYCGYKKIDYEKLCKEYQV